MKNFKIILHLRWALFLIVFLLFSSCNNKEEKLSLALERAGSNKSELLKVIEHYKQSSDGLKLEAAYFLIENMPYHFSHDTTYLYKYRPVIDTISSLKAKGFFYESTWRLVNPIMDSLIKSYPLQDYVYSMNIEDITSIKSEYLINTIDQSFKSYNTNPFKDSISFNDFLNYVLPYRASEGFAIEDWRSYFADSSLVLKHQNFSTMQQLQDSLLYNFKEVQIGWRIADQFPYLKLNDYLTSQVTHCPQKCWFNCLLLRSFGIPVTIDFVPASRVHNIGHEWNSLKMKSGIYPFEPFWNNDIRDLKKIYMREEAHPILGPIQFPKIYRKTFKININELYRHALHSNEEIPPLFQNPFIEDVTKEYFKTFNLESPIIKIIEQRDYAYACILGPEQDWVPVDFGKIKEEKILFRSLGPRNIYLPAYYQFGSIIPAAYPMLLMENGTHLVLHPNRKQTRKIEISHVAFQRPNEKGYKEGFIGATIEGSSKKNFEQSEILYRFERSFEPGTNHIIINSENKYRYFRLTLPNKTIKLNEISFFNIFGGIKKEVRGKLITSSSSDSLEFQKTIDNDLLTAAYVVPHNVTPNSRELKPLDEIWVGYDFERPISIDTFQFYYFLDSNLRKEGVYELLYWDFGWKSLGQKKSKSTKPISFSNVPENALLMIKIRDTGKFSRVFTYSGNKQHWY